MRKDPYELLRICNENSGKVISSNEILKLFGYSKKTSIFDTTVLHFLYKEKYKHPIYYWLLESWALVSKNDYKEITKNHQKVDFKYYGFLINRISFGKLFLVPRKYIPFWKLKEFGGTIA